MKIISMLVLSSLLLFAFARKEKSVVRDLKFIEKNLKYIPPASFVMGRDDESNGKTVSVESFYMFNQEVSNGFYLDFLKDLSSKNEPQKYNAALPDTLVWRSNNSFNEKYVDYYLRHPAYQDYPVVGVTHQQCEMFCEWLTAKYNSDPKRKYKKVVFMLPDSSQREYAASGGLSLSSFPWGGPYLQNEKGQWLANFMVMDQAGISRVTLEKKEYFVASGPSHYSGIAGRLNDFADITAPVTSYNPNGFGLYNMSGNVEEFLLHKGKTMGGSWRDPGYYLQNHVYESYEADKEASSERGFRFVMKVIEYN